MDDERQLHRRLLELHDQLEHTQCPDHDSQQLLRGLMQDIEAVLARGERGPCPEYNSLNERLKETVDREEISQPELTGYIQRVIETLTLFGI